MQRMDVSVVIVSYNTREFLRGCLQSLHSNGFEGQSEIFVVDNASTDRSPDMVEQQFPGVHLVRNRTNMGFSAAFNRAYPLSSGRFVLLLNPDTLVLAGALNTLCSFMEAHSEVGAVGPRQWLDPEKSLQSTVTAKPPNAAIMLARIPVVQKLAQKALRKKFWIKDFEVWNSDSPVCVDTLNGSCMLIKREVIEEVGVLDESFFLFFEDVDWCLRMRSQGWQLFCVPSAEIVHFGMRSVQKMEHIQKISEASLDYYIKKHWGGGGRFLWRLYTFLRFISTKFVGRVKGKHGPSMPLLQKRPASSDKQKEKNVLFRWEPSEGASYYCFEISQDPLFLYKAGAVVDKGCFRLSVFLVDSWPEGRYFWRVAPASISGRLGKFSRPKAFQL